MGAFGIQTIRPTQRALYERMGKYKSYVEPGLTFYIPFIDRIRLVNITEQMVNAEPQEVITKDSLNAIVDAQIYFKVKPDEESVKKSQYAVYNFTYQIVQLARTTLRDIIGNMTLTDANSKRGTLNAVLAKELSAQAVKWGVEVVRAELKEIKPPDAVQAVMNKVVVAEKEKIAALDFAVAVATQADGARQAVIKQAEGTKRKDILEAEGQAQAIVTVADAKAKEIEVVNMAASKYFKDSAVDYKKLQVAESALKDNTKIIVPQGSDLVNIVGESMGITPVPMKKKDK
jgi:regulator of protease activity HflC (stomatin/prohibitin superfamily)